jgi:CheY-like chemotaxis protein
LPTRFFPAVQANQIGSDSLALEGDSIPVGNSAISEPISIGENVSRALHIDAGLRDESAPTRSLAGKKVLVVDDDPRNIFAITSLLERQNMEVLYAENGRDGIRMIEQNPDIDIVLMDIMMPGMDGYETIRLIRDDPKKQWLPVIAVTAKALREDRERCMNAGASDYLAKPIDEVQLVELIKVWANTRPQTL